MTPDRQNSGARIFSFARERLSKHVSVAMNTHATIEELWEVVFSMQPATREHNEDTSRV
jgi:hypothetical protein